MSANREDVVFARQRRLRRGRTQKTAMVVAQQIVEEITRDGLQPGSMLPSEKEMLSAYEVGRGTLRESLRFLEMNGVISIKPGPGGGPVVNAPDSRDLAGSMALFLQLLQTPFHAVVEARLLLEPALAARAAERADVETLARMRKSVEAMEEHAGDEEVFLTENERFHDLLVWASGNVLFGLVISSMQWLTESSSGDTSSVGRCREMAASNRRIFEAIAARDSAEAGAAMLAHLSGVAQHLEHEHPNVWASPLRWQLVV